VRLNILFILFLVLFVSFILPTPLSARDYELYIAQGISKINEGKYKDAIELFEKALALSPENPEATYYAGIAYSRLGKYKEAEDLFLKTLRSSPATGEVYFELGRIYYLTGRCDKAETVLKRHSDLSTEGEAKQYASDLIRGCRERAEEKPYWLNLTTGIQYDSNVTVEPFKAFRKSDFRAVFCINSGATVLKTTIVNLKVDYTFYQSIHNRLNDFNQHFHKISPGFDLVLSDVIIPSGGYSLEYTLMGGELYGRVHTYYGKILVKEGRKLSTEALYEYRDNKYWDSDLFQTNSERSGYQQIVTGKQNFYMNRWSGNIYFFGDFDRAKRGYWSYDGYGAGAELSFRILPFYITLAGEYEESRYKEDFPGFTDRRFDKTQEYSLGITYMITKRIDIQLFNTYTNNDSNLRDFNYERKMTGLFLSLAAL